MKYKFVLLDSASFYMLDPVRKQTLGFIGQICHVKRGATIDNMPVTTVISDSTFDTDGKIPVLVFLLPYYKACSLSEKCEIRKTHSH